SNSWYRPAMDHAEERELESGPKIRLVSPAYFCASKLEAFAGRGNEDFVQSKDIEDLIAVIDGRSELVGEIRSAADDVRGYLAKQAKELLSSPVLSTPCQAMCFQTRRAKKESPRLLRDSNRSASYTNYNACLSGGSD